MAIEGGASGNPRVSVVIATYNRSDALRHTLQSVLWQEFRDFEVLVIGDGCTDDTAAVVASFGDPRIRWHNLAQNSGHQWLPNNTGIAMSRGEYIAYLGHDDLWLPSHLLRLVQVAERTEADIAYAVTTWVGPPGTDFRVLTGLSRSGEYEKGLAMPPTSIMHTRACVDEIGGWRDYREIDHEPDSDLLFRLWAAGKRFAPTNELTAIKFSASWRKNSYRAQRSDEQATYLRRIREESDFVARELLATASSYIWECGIATMLPAQLDRTQRGWKVQTSRSLRGLIPATPTDGGTQNVPELREHWMTGRAFRINDWGEARSQLIAADDATEPAEAVAPDEVEGALDATPPGLVGGWAWDRARPEIPLVVEVFDDDTRMGWVTADLFRADLRDAGAGSGHHGFLFELPPSLRGGRVHTLTLRVAGTGITLRTPSAPDVDRDGDVRSLIETLREKDRQFADADDAARSLLHALRDEQGRFAEIARYCQSLEEDRAARLQQLHEEERYRKSLEEERAAKLKHLHDMEAYIVSLTQTVDAKEREIAEAVMYTQSLEEALDRMREQFQRASAYAQSLEEVRRENQPG